LRRVALGAAAALMPLLALVPAASADPTASEAEEAINKALTNWKLAFNAGDTGAVCGLFAPELRYDYREFPERDYQDVCDVLHHSLTDPTKRYRYALAIKEILVSGDLAVVRLTWTLTVTKADARPEVSQEHGIDVFRRQPDGTWKIIRFIAYDESG
jgi:steroid delta-isomerase